MKIWYFGKRLVEKIVQRIRGQHRILYQEKRRNAVLLEHYFGQSLSFGSNVPLQIMQKISHIKPNARSSTTTSCSYYMLNLSSIIFNMYVFNKTS